MRNGAGLYTLPAPPSPFLNGQTASATDVMTVLNDIAQALTGSMAADGQTPVTANFDWGGYNISNVNTLSATGMAMVGGICTNPFLAGNGTTGSECVTYQQFPVTLATTGTLALPNGMLEKWGTGSTTLGVGSVTFAAAFPSACHNVQISVNGGTTTVSIDPPVIGAVTSAGFDVWGNVAQSLTFYWRAIGS